MTLVQPGKRYQTSSPKYLFPPMDITLSNFYMWHWDPKRRIYPLMGWKGKYLGTLHYYIFSSQLNEIKLKARA
jgi:hypothetical protein